MPTRRGQKPKRASDLFIFRIRKEYKKKIKKKSGNILRFLELFMPGEISQKIFFLPPEPTSSGSL
jgi:hypothetical protein